jgi:Xaa-Pro aminopeptidase
MNFNFQARVKKLRKVLIREKLSGFVTATIEGNNKNVYYLSGFGGTTGALAVSGKSAVLAVDGRYIERASRKACASFPFRRT